MFNQLRVSELVNNCPRGGSRILKKGGGTTYCVFRTAAPPASKVAQVPKKLMSGGEGGGGGGTPTLFFRSAISVESRASPKPADERGGGGGESDTFMCTDTFFLRFQKGGGHGPGVPPLNSPLLLLLLESLHKSCPVLDTCFGLVI